MQSANNCFQHDGFTDAHQAGQQQVPALDVSLACKYSFKGSQFQPDWPPSERGPVQAGLLLARSSRAQV